MFLSRKERRGGAHIGYSMLVGFVSIAGISMVAASGREIKDLFGDSTESIAAGAALLPSSEGPQNGYTGGPVAPGEADPACYHPGNVGTVPSDTYGCGNMLIVDNDMMYSKGSPDHSTALGYPVGDGSYQFDIDGKIYTFGESENMVFTGQLTDLTHLFAGQSTGQNHFNEEISYWDTSRVTKMRAVFFQNSAFNQDIGGWDTSSVTTMETVFSNSTFNQDISQWDVSSVSIPDEKDEVLYGMFYNNSAFNQNLSGWCVSSVAVKPALFDSGTTAWTGGTATRPQWGQPCS